MTNIKNEFQSLDSARGQVLTRARQCAGLTIPTIFPDFARGLTSSGDTQNTSIPTPYHGIGADGVNTLVGKLLTAMFAPGLTWFQRTPSAKLRAFASPEKLEELEGLLYIRELLMHAQLRSVGYTVPMRTQLEHIIVLGNGCFRIRDNYRIRSYRFDNWVQRKVDGELLTVILAEKLDPLQLTPEIMLKAGLKQEDYLKREGDNRLVEMYTKEQKQTDGSWVIEQEINRVIVNTSEEKVNPIITAGYIELTGENYSRSKISEIYADLEQANRISKALGDIAEAAAQYHPTIDPSKGWAAGIFKKPNGAPWIGKTSGGVPEGIGVWRVQKGDDISASAAYLDKVEARLSNAMLLETNLQPTGDRVTATQVARIAAELDGKLGGIYANIADEIQRPLIHRIEWQMERDNLLPPLPELLKDETSLDILTGEAALTRHMQLNQMLSALQTVAQIPGAAQRIRFEVATQMIFQGNQIDTRRLLKSDEDMQAEIENEMARQAQQQATQQTIKSAGSIVEKAADQQLSE